MCILFDQMELHGKFELFTLVELVLVCKLPKWATLQGKTVVSPRTTSISCEVVSNPGSTTWLWGEAAPMGDEDCNTAEWTCEEEPAELLSSLFNGGVSWRNGRRSARPISNESSERDRPARWENCFYTTIGKMHLTRGFQLCYLSNRICMDQGFHSVFQGPLIMPLIGLMNKICWHFQAFPKFSAKIPSLFSAPKSCADR